jgi:CRP-like cAMP-binding protein
MSPEATGPHMADDARIQRLSQELFLAAAAPSSIPSWAIERMASLLEEQELEAGDRLFSAGDAPAYIYFMRDGRLRMTRNDEAPLTFEGRWALGGFDVLMDQPYRRTATALAHFRVQRLPSDAWLELLEDSFEIALSMLGNAGRTLARLEERLGTAAPRDAAVLPLMSLPEGPLNLVERLTVLTDIPTLRGAGIQTLADLAVLANEVAFERGEVLVARGSPQELAYVVFDGQVEVSRSAPDVVERYGPGTLVFGAVGLGFHSSTGEARAKGRTRTLAIRVEDVVDVMEEHFDLVRSVLASVAAERERLLDESAARSGGLVLQ